MPGRSAMGEVAAWIITVDAPIAGGALWAWMGEAIVAKTNTSIDQIYVQRFSMMEV